MANQATSIVGLKEFLTANFAATLDEALISDLATTLAPRIEEWLGGNYRAGHKDGWEQAQKEIVARLGSFAEDLVAKIEKALGSGERKDASVSLVDLILLLAVGRWLRESSDQSQRLM